jgi:hypothetical protein
VIGASSPHSGAQGDDGHSRHPPKNHQVRSRNHGIGVNTAEIEIILPTSGERLGLKCKIADTGR